MAVRAEAIRAEGEVAACQRVHLGRETPGAETWLHRVAPSSVRSPRSGAPAAFTLLGRWSSATRSCKDELDTRSPRAAPSAKHILRAHATRAAVPAQA